MAPQVRGSGPEVRPIWLKSENVQNPFPDWTSFLNMQFERQFNSGFINTKHSFLLNFHSLWKMKHILRFNNTSRPILQCKFNDCNASELTLQDMNIQPLTKASSTSCLVQLLFIHINYQQNLQFVMNKKYFDNFLIKKIIESNVRPLRNTSKFAMSKVSYTPFSRYTVRLVLVKRHLPSATYNTVTAVAGCDW